MTEHFLKPPAVCICNLNNEQHTVASLGTLCTHAKMEIEFHPPGDTNLPPPESIPDPPTFIRRMHKICVVSLALDCHVLLITQTSAAAGIQSPFSLAAQSHSRFRQFAADKLPLIRRYPNVHQPRILRRIVLHALSLRRNRHKQVRPVTRHIGQTKTHLGNPRLLLNNDLDPLAAAGKLQPAAVEPLDQRPRSRKHVRHTFRHADSGSQWLSKPS